VRDWTVPKLARSQALIIAALVAYSVLGWQGLSTVGRDGAIDAAAHLQYAQYLDTHGSTPPKSLNQEYATPPLFHLVAIGAEHLVRAVPSWALVPHRKGWTRGGLLALVALALASLTSAQLGRRRLGVLAAAIAVVWGLDIAVSLGKTMPWAAGQLIAFASALGLIGVTGLIAREVWPESPRRAVAAGAFVAAYPVVYRMGILFHPEVPFALLCASAMLFFLRGVRLGWPVRLGWSLGAACGAAAATRESALVVMGVTLAATLAVGRRQALPFLARAAVVAVVVASPWWIYAGAKWHNPIQSNLRPRATLMMPHQPASFYVGLPLRDLVLHPYRPVFSDMLLPKLHAELWSDWFGSIHSFWEGTSRVDRVTASTQSVLGLVADGLALFGLGWLAVPAAIRVARRRRERVSDVGLGFLAVLATAAFVAFVVMVMRFPQRYGDPIKSSYLLFTAPCWAIFSVCAWSQLARRAWIRRALVAAATLYVASYGTHLGAALQEASVRAAGPPPGIDVNTQVFGSIATAKVGDEVNFTIWFTNTGTETATGIVATVDIPPGLKLLAQPLYEHGTGCVGTTRLICHLDYVNGNGQQTPLHLQTQAVAAGAQMVEATMTADQRDLNPPDDTGSFRVYVISG